MSLIFLSLVLSEPETELREFGIVSVSFLSAYCQGFFTYFSSTYYKTANDSLGLIIARSPVQVRVGQPFLYKYHRFISTQTRRFMDFGAHSTFLKNTLCCTLFYKTTMPALLTCQRHKPPIQFKSLVQDLIMKAWRLTHFSYVSTNFPANLKCLVAN
jgi:hypothetical protein